MSERFPCVAPTVIWRHLPSLPQGTVVTYGKDLQATVSILADDVRFDADVWCGFALAAPALSPAAVGEDLRDVENLTLSKRKHFHPAIPIALRKRPAKLCFRRFA